MMPTCSLFRSLRSLTTCFLLTGLTVRVSAQQSDVAQIAGTDSVQAEVTETPSHCKPFWVKSKEAKAKVYVAREKEPD